MKTYRITNGEGLGKTVAEKVRESFQHYECNVEIIGGEREGYGNPEYIDILTDQDINSEVMQSIAYNTKVIEL